MQPYSPLNRDDAFPIQRLLRIEVAGVQEAGVDLDDSPETAGLDHPPDPLDGGNEGELRGASHEHVRVFGRAGQDGVVGRLVDAERFFAEQMFSGRR